jgi:hypothetical protein
MKEKRVPIGFVEATVRFPLYEGDKTTTPGGYSMTWDWFEYNEPGITETGEIGTCRRKCEVLKAEVKRAEAV